MNSKLKYLHSAGMLLIFYEGKQHIIREDDAFYAEACKVIDSKPLNEEKLLRFILSPEQLKVKLEELRSKFEFRVTEDSRVFVNDEELTGLIVERIHQCIIENKSIAFIEKFLERAWKNPSEASRKELFEFLSVNDLPITNSGTFLAYKRVDENFKDCHTGKIDNSVGATPSMPREKVNSNRHETCSTGLHFASFSYMQHYHGANIVVLEIDPADVVSIPTDYNQSKGRACKYKVVAVLNEAEDRIKKNVVSGKKNITESAVKQAPAKKKLTLKEFMRKSGFVFITGKLSSWKESSSYWMLFPVPAGESYKKALVSAGKQNPEIFLLERDYNLSFPKAAETSDKERVAVIKIQDDRLRPSISIV
jgi:hypothetical protein